MAISSSWNYPASIIKNAVIGIGAGFVDHYTSLNYVAPFCKSNTDELGQYLCLQSAKFFDPQNLSQFQSPVIKALGSIREIVERFIPQVIELHARNCNSLYATYGSNLIKLEMRTLYALSECCETTLSNKIIAAAFAEELIFRFGIQKVALLSIASLCPKRVGKVLSHPASRILITSLLFAFAHGNDSVLPQFVGGLTHGIVYEQYGLLASSISHSTANLVSKRENRPNCEILIENLNLKFKKYGV